MIEPIHDALVRAGALAPVALGRPEERSWLDCDLASLAENRLGDLTDPRDLDGARRAEWLARAVDEPPISLARRSRHERCYWLLDGGQRAGTVALATGTLGGERLRLSSLYVLPSCRHRGVGRRAMARVMETLARHGLGLRLETSWCWQRTVSFYAGLGLWVSMWKRELDLCWDPATPPPRIEVGEETASLAVPSTIPWSPWRGRTGAATGSSWTKCRERSGTTGASARPTGIPSPRSRSPWRSRAGPSSVCASHCVFRSHLDTGSGATWTPVPAALGHWFRRLGHLFRRLGQ